jgi:hypothetical protein
MIDRPIIQWGGKRHKFNTLKNEKGEITKSPKKSRKSLGTT